MRHPDSSRGKSPSTCHACRIAHPAESWCDFHNAAHPRDQFRPDGRPIGVMNICRAALSARASQVRGHAPIACISCGELLESWNFRGGQSKAPACRDCESANKGQRWCLDCAAWLPESRFHRTGKEGKFWTVRCKRCKIAHSHGVTVKGLLALQGCDEPCCAACGSTDQLKIDHDHKCCASDNSCGKCARGWLCHSCNTAEGLLRTSGRARLLAEYMAKHCL